MIILHRETPSSLLKAAMLARLHGGLCLHAGEMEKTILQESSIDCDTLSMEEIRKDYELRLGKLDWLDSKKARQLAGAVFYASRYRAKDRFRLATTVILQALEYGPDYVLSRVSPEARSMFNRSRQVCVEIQRAYGFIRLKPVKDIQGSTGITSSTGICGILVGKAEFRHNVCDLVLRYFSRRHRGCRVYLIEKNLACFLEGSKVSSTDAGKLPFALPGDDFDIFWETYYDSQNIEGRKNPALARKHLPKKYWSWVPEGNKLT